MSTLPAEPRSRPYTGPLTSEASPEHSSHRLLLWTVLIALAVRLIVVAFVYQDFLDPQRDHWLFGFENGRIARSIVEGHRFGNAWGDTGPTAILTPVIPYLLAGIFALFGVYTRTSALVMLALSSLFAALTCVPIFFVARKTFGLRVARFAAWLWVFFPYSVYFSTATMWDHSLLPLVLTLLLWISLSLESWNGLWPWIGFGILWGLSTLLNPVTLAVFPFLTGWTCYRLRRCARTPPLVPAVAVLLALLVTITPWLIRNERIFHRAVLKDNFWLEVSVGNLHNTLHWWDASMQPVGSPVEMAEYRELGEIGYMDAKRVQAIDFLKNHLGIYASRSLRRFVYLWTGFWSFNPEYLKEEPLDPENIFFCTLFTLLAIIGLWKAFHAAPGLTLPYVLLLFAFPAVYYFTHPELAYREPVDPEVVILAAYALASWLPSSRKQSIQIG